MLPDLKTLDWRCLPCETDARPSYDVAKEILLEAKHSSLSLERLVYNRLVTDN